MQNGKEQKNEEVQTKEMEMTPFGQNQHMGGTKIDTGQLNEKLLETLDRQNQGLAQQQARLTLSHILLGVFLVLCMLTTTAWNTWQISIIKENVLEQTKLMEQTKKYVWELKTAQNLKFSQERTNE